MIYNYIDNIITLLKVIDHKMKTLKICALLLISLNCPALFKKPKQIIHHPERIVLNHCCPQCYKITKNKAYCSRKCYNQHRRKPFIICNGYKKILKHGHHRADKNGYVYEHVLVMEKHLGRLIKLPEEIHHKDKCRSNNAISNLLLCKNHEEHMKHHRN